MKIVSEKILKRVSGIRPKRVKLPKSHRVSEENPGVESAQKKHVLRSEAGKLFTATEKALRLTIDNLK